MKGSTQRNSGCGIEVSVRIWFQQVELFWQFARVSAGISSGCAQLGQHQFDGLISRAFQTSLPRGKRLQTMIFPLARMRNSTQNPRLGLCIELTLGSQVGETSPSATIGWRSPTSGDLRCQSIVPLWVAIVNVTRSPSARSGRSHPVWRHQRLCGDKVLVGRNVEPALGLIS